MASVWTANLGSPTTTTTSMNKSTCQFVRSTDGAPPSSIQTQSKTMTEEQLAHFRTQVCPRKRMADSCDLEERCPFSHCLSWHRRNPYLNSYRPALCPNVKFLLGPNKKMRVRNFCRWGRSCLYSHTKEEQMYHPLVYKTQLCRDYPQCVKLYCPFAHGEADRRNVTTALELTLPVSSQTRMAPRLPYALNPRIRETFLPLYPLEDPQESACAGGGAGPTWKYRNAPTWDTETCSTFSPLTSDTLATFSQAKADFALHRDSCPELYRGSDNRAPSFSSENGSDVGYLGQVPPIDATTAVTPFDGALPNCMGVAELQSIDIARCLGEGLSPVDSNSYSSGSHRKALSLGELSLGRSSSALSLNSHDGVSDHRSPPSCDGGDLSDSTNSSASGAGRLRQTLSTVMGAVRGAVEYPQKEASLEGGGDSLYGAEEPPSNLMDSLLISTLLGALEGTTSSDSDVLACSLLGLRDNYACEAGGAKAALATSSRSTTPSDSCLNARNKFRFVPEGSL